MPASPPPTNPPNSLGKTPPVVAKVCHTKKSTDIYQSDSLIIAVTSMQGWRDEMEDAYCVVLPKESVLDRHALGMRAWRDGHRQIITDQFLDATIQKDAVMGCTPHTPDGHHHNMGLRPSQSAAVMSGTPAAAGTFFSSGCGSVRFGTSVDVGAVHTKQHVSKIANGSVHSGGAGKTARMTLCGVFDGHGGSMVSEAIAKSMGEWVLSSPSFSKHLYERAIHDAFVVNDAKMHDQWSKDRAWYGFAGSTANVVLIIEEFSNDVTRRIERRRRATTTGDDGSLTRTSSMERAATTNDVIAASNSTSFGGGFGGSTPLQMTKSYDFHSVPADEAAGGGEGNAANSYDEIRIICANAGDSRAILCRVNGLVVPLSADHKPSNAAEKERITAAHGTVSTGACDRIDGVLAVSRGFGDYLFKSDKSLKQEKQLVIPHPDVRTTHQRKDFKGRYCYPWLEFGSANVFTDSIIARANTGDLVKGRRHHRTAAERELLHLQKCLHWMPTQQQPALNSFISPADASTHQSVCSPTLGGGGGRARSSSMQSASCPVLGNEYYSPPTPQADPYASRPPSPQSLANTCNGGGFGSSPHNGTVNGLVSFADAEYAEPLPFELCDGSAMSSALFIAQGCDGIWDCISNEDLSAKVVSMLDAQLTAVLKQRMEKADRRQRSRHDKVLATTRPNHSPLVRGGIGKVTSMDSIADLTSERDDSRSASSSSGSDDDAEREHYTALASKHFQCEKLTAAARRMKPFKDIATTVQTDKIAEAIVTYCLETSFVPPLNKKTTATTSPGVGSNSSSSTPSPPATSAGGPATSPPAQMALSPGDRTPPADGTKNPLLSSADGRCSSASPTPTSCNTPQLVACSSSSSGHMPVPPKPLNANGTDNMTFALIFFKDGVTHRAMMLHRKLALEVSLGIPNAATNATCAPTPAMGSPTGVTSPPIPFGANSSSSTTKQADGSGTQQQVEDGPCAITTKEDGKISLEM